MNALVFRTDFKISKKKQVIVINKTISTGSVDV